MSADLCLAHFTLIQEVRLGTWCDIDEPSSYLYTGTHTKHCLRMCHKYELYNNGLRMIHKYVC